MLIDLTQHATRCSDSSGQAQEYLIARHAAVETETVLVQICLELGAPSVICSLKECFQITDCLVYPMQIICFVFLCVQFHTFQIQVAFVTVAFYLCFWHKILVDDFLQSLSLYVIYCLHPGKQRHSPYKQQSHCCPSATYPYYHNRQLSTLPILSASYLCEL